MDLQTLGLASGVTLLGALSLQGAAAVVQSRLRLRAARKRFAMRSQRFADQLETNLQWARATRPVLKAWSGTRPFRVVAVVDEAVDCKSFYLVPTDGRPLPRYEPGQYLTFHLPVDPRSKPLVRCYSLSDRSREDYYRVTIKRAQPPTGRPDLLPGRGSSYFHDHVEVADSLDVQAPSGSFFLDPTDKLPVVLIGAGIGMTPILSMVNTIAYDQQRQATYLFVGFGNSSEHPFREHMAQLAAANDHLQYDLSYSRPAPGDQIGRDYHHRGRVDIARLREILPSNNFCFYICGPAGMMESLVPDLLAWGVPESHVRFEAFGPATVKSLSTTRTMQEIAAGPCNVEFLLTHASLAWDSGCGSLLEFAESSGVSLDYGCRAGNCGQCLVKVQQGRVAHVKQPGLPVADDECLACIGVPQGDVVLEA